MDTPRNNSDPILMSFMAVRRAVGILGISLPALLIAGTTLIGDCTAIQATVSHYYYTVMGFVFVGILCAVALFLILYKGYTATDDIATNFAGICALGVAFFPTSENLDSVCSILVYKENKLREGIHYTSAGLFFLTLACISFFLFTKSRGQKTKQKRIRNRIYRICAVAIVFFCALIALVGMFGPDINKYQPVFWFEWGALFAFGMSWLIKGEFLLADE
ncbi:hypothetical protein [Spirosoma areae]